MTEATTTYPYEEGGFTVIGPECFTDGTVLSLKGENYYRACGHMVIELEGFTSSCVKRVNHPGIEHEDYIGNTNHEVYGVNPDRIEIPIPAVGEGVLVNRLDIREAWDEYIKPTQDEKKELSDPQRTIAACMRVINEALPTEPVQP